MIIQTVEMRQWSQVEESQEAAVGDHTDSGDEAVVACSSAQGVTESDCHSDLLS